MKDKFGLTGNAIEKINQVFARYNTIEKVIIYGSRAKGNFKPGSDIDLTIQAQQMDLSQLLKIENEIDDLMLPYQLDLSLFHQIENEDLKSHIKRVGQIFYAR